MPDYILYPLAILGSFRLLNRFSLMLRPEKPATVLYLSSDNWEQDALNKQNSRN